MSILAPKFELAIKSSSLGQKQVKMETERDSEDWNLTYRPQASHKVRTATWDKPTNKSAPSIIPFEKDGSIRTKPTLVENNDAFVIRIKNSHDERVLHLMLT